MASQKSRARIATFPRRVGQTQATVGIDLQWENRAPVRALEWVNSLRVSSRDEPEVPDALDEGVPVSEPPDPQLGHELFLVAQHEAPDAPVLVGSITTRRSAEWFVYSPEPCAEQIALAVSAQFPALRVEARVQHDPEWSVFREFLLPSPLERQLIRNRRLVRELQQNGYDPFEAVILDHTLWFNSTDDRSAFAESSACEGFWMSYPDESDLEIAALDLPGAQDGEVAFGLTLSMHSRIRLEELDPLVTRLFKDAARFGGEYEGWHPQQD